MLRDTYHWFPKPHFLPPLDLPSGPSSRELVSGPFSSAQSLLAPYRPLLPSFAAYGSFEPSTCLYSSVCTPARLHCPEGGSFGFCTLSESGSSLWTDLSDAGVESTSFEYESEVCSPPARSDPELWSFRDWWPMDEHNDVRQNMVGVTRRLVMGSRWDIVVGVKLCWFDMLWRNEDGCRTYINRRTQTMTSPDATTSDRPVSAHFTHDADPSSAVPGKRN